MSASDIVLPAALQPASVPAGLPVPDFVLPDPLGRIGDLELRLAQKPKDIRKAQKLRYKVFFEEMSAVPNVMARLARRDVDIFDTVCDHLLVRDAAPRPLLNKRTVGTYRLLRQEIAERNFGFYTQGEFDIAPLLARHSHLNFLELGRSCVLAPWRDRRTVELLWHGIWAYVLAHRIDVMLGCASLEGTDPKEHQLALSYLHHFHRAPEAWRAEALPARRADIPLLNKEDIDPKKALRALPPLIKGYLRLGAVIGDGAVADRQFGTTDILMVMPRAFINPRYIHYYGADAARHAA
jgi:putative hemolysin